MANDAATRLLDSEVDVKAGQTVVLDVKTSGQSEGPGNGSFEITLFDVDGSPTAPGPIIYLVNDTGNTTYKVEIDTDQQSPGYGTGKLDDIKAGKYPLSLEEPVMPIPIPPGEQLEPVKWEENIYFGLGDYGISKAGGLELEKIAMHLADEAQANVKEVRCIGYADNRGSEVKNMNLSIQRGASARKVLKEKLDVNMLQTSRPKPEIKSTGKGELPGETETDWKENRRVEVWLRGEMKVGASPPLPNPRIRPCCLLVDNYFGLYNNIFDPLTMSFNHYYSGNYNTSEKNGIVYTCAAGFIDLGHIRDCIDLTRFYFEKLQKFSKKGDKFTLIYYPDAEVNLLSDLPASDKVLTARSICYAESIFHEIESYWKKSVGYHNSSFSIEDLVSNYFGTYLFQVCHSKTSNFNTSVTTELKNFITTLGGVKQSDTESAFKKVVSTWIGTAWRDSGYLKKRNFSTSPVNPWLLPGFSVCTGKGSIPQDAMSEIPAKIKAYYKIKFKVPTHAQAVHGTTMLNQDFTKSIQKIKDDAKILYGNDYDKQ